MSYLKQRQILNYEGGGAFKTYNILHPLGFPHALITVLFRPFPWESHNLQAMVQSLEGVVLMGLILWRIKSIGRAVVFSISDRYLRYMLLYMVAYVITTTAVGNLGIVVRQRDMFLPFLFMLIAYGPLGPAPGAKSNSPGLNEGIHPLNPIRKANSLDQH